MKKLLLFCFLVTSIKVFAQDSTKLQYPAVDKLSAYIYTGNIIPKGRHQLDWDFNYGQARLPEDKTPYLAWDNMKVRYGLSDFIEIRIGHRRINSHSDQLVAIGYHTEDSRNTGIDFLSFGAKATIFSYNQTKGSLAILIDTYLPIQGRKATALDIPIILPVFSFINEHHINRWLGYTLNAGASYNKWEISPYRIDFAAAANFYHGKKLSSFLGFSNYFYSQKLEPGNFLNTGVLYAVTRDIQIRSSFSLKLDGDIKNTAVFEGLLGIAWHPNFQQ